ncbi:MAG: hypothetical protein ACRYGP_33275 [Janthinobacterium lividum]
MGLKILHVGNIAQNGYINASILRARGNDCDLVAPDLYHAGSSPEWYELSTGDVDPALLGNDPFFPNFYALGRTFPEIGDWVAQGPYLQTMMYLLLKRRGDPHAHLARAALCYYRFKSTVQRSSNPVGEPLDQRTFEAFLKQYDLRPGLRNLIRIGRMAEDYWTSIVDRISMRDANARNWIPPISREALSQHCAFDPYLDGIVCGLRAQGLAEALFIEFPGPLMDYAHGIRHGFTVDELIPYLWGGHVLRNLAALYDLVIFYGDWCKFAFAAGIEGYWALEHGTIRTLPFEPNANGRLVAAGFLGAARVLLTNTDYATAKPRLEFVPEQRIYFPHPFNEVQAATFLRDHLRCVDASRAVFFCPARQDWRVPDPRMAKGNDLYFRAGRLLLDQGRSDFLFHCVDWGVDREASRALVAELGLTNHVKWSPMMPKGHVWAAMVDAHSVIDQFLLSAFGAATVEALALSCRLISRDDGVNNAVFFAVPPPVLAAANAEEIKGRMLAVMDDPDDTARAGERGIEWVRKYHSADRIYALQMAAFTPFQKMTQVADRKLAE